MKVYGADTFVALFDEKIRQYEITYTVDGEEYSRQKVDYGKTSEVEDPVKTSTGAELWLFTGWMYEDGTVFDPLTPIVENVNVQAIFDKAYNVSGKVSFPTSYFKESYAKYYQAKVTSGKYETTVDENGNFSFVLTEGEHTVIASCDGFKAVSSKLTVSENSVDFGELKFVEHVYTTGMAYENNVITPVVGQSTTYQTAIFTAQTQENAIIIRQKINPQLGYMTHGEQIGFRVQSKTVTLNMLVTSNRVRVMFNNDWYNNKEFVFTGTSANINNLTDPYTLTLIVERGNNQFNISVFVNDVFAVKTDLMQVADFSNNGKNYSYKSLLSTLISGNISAGVMVNYSNGKYTTNAPITISDVDFGYGNEVVDQYANNEYNVSGKVTLPAHNMFGEVVNVDLSSASLLVDGFSYPLKADGTFSVVVRAGSRLFNATVSGYIGEDKVIDVNANLENVQIDIKYYDFETKSNGALTDKIKVENGVITPLVDGYQGYQTMTFKNGTASETLMITQTVNPTSAYMKNTDYQQSAFYVEDASVAENNIIILNMGQKLRILRNRTWATNVEVPFIKNVNTNSYTTPFVLTAIIERSATNKTFMFRMYVDGVLVVEKDIATLSGSNGLQYKDVLPYSNMKFGFGANFATNAGFSTETGSPIALDNLDYTITKSVINDFELKNSDFTVTVNNESGVKQSESVYRYGSLINTIPTPEKTNDAQYTYMFKGWEIGNTGKYWDFETDKVTGDVTLTPVFDKTVNKYTILFLNEDSSEYAKYENVEYGTLISLPQNPIKEGSESVVWVFAGWSGYSENMTVTANHTFVASFSSTSAVYTVKFINAGEIINEETLVFGSAITAPTVIPQKQGDVQYSYKFSGWSGYSENMTVSTNHEFEAEFTPVLNKYAITFINGEDTFAIENLEYGSEIKTSSIPEKEQNGVVVYSFSHWSLEEDGTEFSGAVDGEKTLYAVFVEKYITRGKVLFTSYFEDNYSSYKISDAVVTIGSETISVSSDGMFECVLEEGEYQLSVEHANFESVSKTLAVSNDSYDWGEIKLEHHIITVDRMTYVNGVLTPKSGNETTYQTSAFNTKISTDSFVVREKVMPTDLYMTNFEQIGFRIEGGNNKKLNILITGNQMRIIFNNNYSTVSNSVFANASININNMTEEYYLSAVIERSDDSFVISIFVNDTLVLTSNLAGVIVHTNGTAYNYNDYLPFTEELSVGPMVNMSNNKYSAEPLTLSDIDYSINKDVIDSYFNDKYVVFGRVSIPSAIAGEDYIDEYYSSLAVMVNGAKVTVNSIGTFASALTDKGATVTVSVSASGSYVASEIVKTVDVLSKSNAGIGVITVSGHINTTESGFTQSVDGVIVAYAGTGNSLYQKAYVASSANTDTLIMRETINPTQYYMTPINTTGGATTNYEQIGFYMMNKAGRYWYFYLENGAIKIRDNDNKNITIGTSPLSERNAEFKTNKTPYTLTIILERTRTVSETTETVSSLKLSWYLSYVPTDKTESERVTVCVANNIEFITSAYITGGGVQPTGEITQFGASVSYSTGKSYVTNGRYPLTITDFAYSVDKAVVVSEKARLFSLVSAN